MPDTPKTAATTPWLRDLFDVLRKAPREALWLFIAFLLSGTGGAASGIWSIVSGSSARAERETLDVRFSNESTYLRGEIRELKLDTRYQECLLEPTNGDSVIVINNQRIRYCQRVRSDVEELLLNSAAR